MATLSIVLLLLVIFSECLFFLITFNWRIEDTIPISCFAIVIISFFFGFFDLLKYSTYVLLTAGIILYIYLYICICKDKNKIKLILKNIISPGIIVFFLFNVIFIVTIQGKLFSAWDEFSHWGDIVKVMTTLDDFGTNNLSMSSFKSYPPGMSLFQYILEKLYFIISRNDFVEWLVYYGYYLLSISVFIPFTKNFSYKHPLTMIEYIIILIFVPFTFYKGVYYEIYIDPFLSFLFSAGLLHILFDDENNITHKINLISIFSMLVLAKDAGLVLAISLFIAFAIKIIIQNKQRIENKIIYLFSSMSSISIPKLMWSYKIKTSGVTPSFNERIDFNNLWQVIIGKDFSYRLEVLKKYKIAFGLRGIELNIANINICYTVLFIIIILCFIVIIYKYKNINSITSCVCAVFTSIIFICGMCVLYMYKFSEYEALSLASFNRYMNIVFMGCFLFIFIAFTFLTKNNKNIFLLLCIFILFTCPINNVSNWMLRKQVTSSCNERSKYEKIVNETLKYANGKSHILFISQESNGFDCIVYKYSVRPNYCCGAWSIGYEFYPGDIWTIGKTAYQLQQELINEYDYVAIYKLNSYFFEEYSGIFEDPSDIFEDSIYMVNKTNGMLKRCK